MSKRKLRIVRPSFPVTGVCEHCSQTFISRNEDVGIGATDVEVQFAKHTCKSLDSSQNALRVVREATEDK